MGCHPVRRALGQRGLDDLIVDAAEETFASAGLTKDEVDAYWFGHGPVRHERHHPGPAAPSSRASRHPVENYCTTGSDGAPGRRLRVASGAYDVAMAWAPKGEGLRLTRGSTPSPSRTTARPAR